MSDTNAAVASVSVDSSETRDEYNRLESERTFTLPSKLVHDIAEEMRVHGEKNDTWIDTLAYVVKHGFQELGRTRNQTLVREDKARIAEAAKTWDKVFDSNPAMMENLDTVKKMLAELKPRVEARTRSKRR